MNTRVCGRCDQDRRIIANWPDGPVCSTCYNQARWRRGICHRCETERPLPGRDAEGRWLCVPCSGVPVDLVCSRCGLEAYRPARKLCPCCLLDDHLDTLEAGPAAHTIAPLLEAMRTRSLTIAYSTLLGLRRPLMAQTLADLAAGRVALDHATFDQLPRTDLVDQLRALLVAHGVLSSRDRNLVRFDDWAEAKLATIGDPGQRRLLEHFIAWHYNRRFRALADHGQLRHGHILGGRQSVTVAAQFLSWLANRGQDLSHLGQADLDEWLSEPPTTRWRVGPLIGWAQETGRTRGVKMPTRSFGSRTRLSRHEQVELLGRLFHDDHLGLPARIAGALALLYAHPVTRSVRLTVDDVRIGTNAGVRLGTGFVPLLDPLTLLLTAQLESAVRPRGRGHPPTRWLFPGRIPGHHLGAGHVHGCLHAAGVDIKSSKNTAIAAMVSELPGPVVADALNLSPSTVDRWARSVAAPWQNYANRPRSGYR